MYVCNPLTAPDFLGDIRGVVFDCDGVLIDSRDANRMYYNLIRQHLGLLSLTPEEEDYVHIHSVAECLRRIIPPELMAEAEAFRREMDYAEVLEYVTLEPGLERLLAFLHERGLRMAVNTNRTTTMDLILETFGLTRYFHPVVTTAKVSSPKPSPEGVTMILSAWNLPASAVAYLGDSALDERTSRAAGTQFWAYKNPGLLAAMHVPDFDTLRRCLGLVPPPSESRAGGRGGGRKGA